MFEKFGKGLRGQDSITLKSERRREAVVFDAVVRDRLAKWTPPIYQDIVRVTGEVTEADVVSHKFKITLPHDGVIEGQFPPERELDLTSALHKHAHVRVTISGSGEYSSHDASLVRIVRIDAIEPATTAEDGYDFSAPPIWEMAAAIGAAVPIEEWDKVPTDLARNFDRYAYGPGGNEPE